MSAPPLVDFAIALPVALGLAYLIARVIRRVFGVRLRLPLTGLTIISLLGVSIGILIAAYLPFGQRLWTPVTLLLAFGSSIGLTVVVAAVDALLNRYRRDVEVSELVESGESDRVEFKETARWNVRDDKKDPRMELTVAKTVAAFLNSAGGVLVIGVTDAGEVRGLDRDLATLRTPDHDRFELWLRDMLSTLLGRPAAALPRIRFAPAASGVMVCAVQCPPSPRPVYLTQSKDGGSTDLWVRVGNSTRSLGVDDAVAYVTRHWRPNLGSWLVGRPVGR